MCKIVRSYWTCVVVATGLAGMASGGLREAEAAEFPKVPPVSSFAPAEDLTKLVEQYVSEFEAGLATEQDYTDKKIRLTQVAHTLPVLAVALGLHDKEHALKASAPALLATSQELSKAKDYAQAKAAFPAVKAAATGQGKGGPELKWNQKVASLGEIMKQVSSTDTRLRRNMRRFEQLADENARSATLLAVIAQAAMGDTHEVKNPEDLGKWYEMCADMRDAAASVSSAIRAKDRPAADMGIKRLMQSCDDCHAVFQIE